MCALAVRLRDPGTGAAWVEAGAVEGLFEAGAAGGRGGERELSLRGVVGPVVGPGRLGPAEVALLDDAGAVLGAYPVEAVTVGPVDGRDAVVRCSFHRFPHPAAGAVWQEWARAFPSAPGGWATGGAEHRAGWLEVARLHAATPGARAGERGGGTYGLDGRALVDRAALYCALGEAVKGPGGYYGANLDALHDCLTGGSGPRPPFTLRWHHAAVARAHLGEEYADAFAATLREAGVELARG
ncbi:barstar family protein [Streptomyces zhaozhouensis]|nr:barstar family protein [Streptomyces zhaozhouensis]